MVGSEDDSRGGTERRFDYTDDVRHTQTAEQRPEKEVLEPSWAGRKVIY
jgi:hypothetical protein